MFVSLWIVLFLASATFPVAASLSDARVLPVSIGVFDVILAATTAGASMMLTVCQRTGVGIY
jgi:hypothetical protein